MSVFILSHLPPYDHMEYNTHSIFVMYNNTALQKCKTFRIELHAFFGGGSRRGGGLCKTIKSPFIPK